VEDVDIGHGNVRMTGGRGVVVLGKTAGFEKGSENL